MEHKMTMPEVKMLMTLLDYCQALKATIEMGDSITVYRDLRGVIKGIQLSLEVFGNFVVIDEDMVTTTSGNYYSIRRVTVNKMEVYCLE